MDSLTFTEIAYGSAAYEATVAFRYRVLRAPLGLNFKPEELASEHSSFHLTCSIADELVACLILMPESNSVIRMRQVAVAPAWQRQSIGRALVAFAEEFAQQRGFATMTLHARESAMPFYEKSGYQRVGERFEEVSLPHWAMEKALGA